MTKKLYITALSIGLLIICVYFLIDSMSQRNKQTTLETQITNVIETINLIPEIPTDLEQRLADIEARLIAEKSSISGQVNTTQVIDNILDMSGTSQINVAALTTTPWALVNIGGYKYSIFTINLDVEGETNNLITFLRTLKNELPESVSVQHLAVTGNSEQMTDTESVTASLDIAIYTQPPDTDNEASSLAENAY